MSTISQFFGGNSGDKGGVPVGSAVRFPASTADLIATGGQEFLLSGKSCNFEAKYAEFARVAPAAGGYGVALGMTSGDNSASPTLIHHYKGAFVISGNPTNITRDFKSSTPSSVAIGAGNNYESVETEQGTVIAANGAYLFDGTQVKQINVANASSAGSMHSAFVDNGICYVCGSSGALFAPLET